MKSMKESNHKNTEFAKELAIVRHALAKAEELRFAQGLTNAQKKELEQCSLELRDRERELIAEVGKEIAAKIELSGRELEEIAKQIRLKNAKIGKTTKVLNSLRVISKYL